MKTDKNDSAPGLDQLRNTEMSLAMEIDQLEHELRRVNDGLERGVGRGLEQEAMRLKESIKLCRRDLKAIQQQQLFLLKHEVSR